MIKTESARLHDHFSELTNPRKSDSTYPSARRRHRPPRARSPCQTGEGAAMCCVPQIHGNRVSRFRQGTMQWFGYDQHGGFWPRLRHLPKDATS